MKTITATFAALLLAGASSAALAQDRDHDRAGDHPQGQAHAQAPQGQAHAPAPQAPQAGPAAGPAGGRGFDRQGGGDHDRGGQRFQNGSPGTPAPTPGPQRFDRGQGPGANAAPGGGHQFDRERGPREVTPLGGDRGPDRNFDGRRDGRDGGPRADGRADPRFNPGSNRPGDNRFSDNRNGFRGDDHRGGPSPWRGGEHWQPGRAPPVFWAQDRFRIGSYRPPYGYYVRTWGYGDILPRGWYAQNYWLNDFLSYDLPYPPPGYEWVRVGGDALMIDRYSGRIVQVVRGIFW